MSELFILLMKVIRNIFLILIGLAVMIPMIYLIVYLTGSAILWANLIACVTLAAGAGTLYAVSTVVHPLIAMVDFTGDTGVAGDTGVIGDTGIQGDSGGGDTGVTGEF